MNRIALALALIAAPLALAGCAKGPTDPATQANGSPLAKVAPPAGKPWSDVVTKTPEGGYRMGNPDAQIKVIEFGSLTCPHCAEFSEKSSAQMRDTFVASGRVSYEFRNFVRDAIDITAAQLTHCGAPESFFPLTEQVYANQPAIFTQVQKAGEAAYGEAMKQSDAQRGIALGQVTGLTDFFAARGLAKDQANACLSNAAEATALAKRTQDQAEQYTIDGTPTFIINGSKFEGNTWEVIKARLEAMGAR